MDTKAVSKAVSKPAAAPAVSKAVSKPAAAPAVSKAVSKPKGVRVRATALGFYNNKRRRPGDEFVIKGDMVPGKQEGEPDRLRDFSGAWMELVETAPKPVAQVAELEEEENGEGEGEGDGEGQGDGESVI